MPDEQLARALGSKIRRDMIRALLKEELPVHKIAEKMGISEVNSSKHLKKLYDLGLLNTHVEGRVRYYSIQINELAKLIKWYDVVTLQLGGKK